MINISNNDYNKLKLIKIILFKVKNLNFNKFDEI